MDLCSVHNCDGRKKTRNLCQAHYMRLWSRGDINAGRPVKRRIIGDDERRFWSKVAKGETCWEWKGPKTKGYGIFHVGGGNILAHRYAYQLTGRYIPKPFQLDHLCRNPGCVRVSHMQVVTNKVNTLRGISPNAQNARKTVCAHGHPFTPENTYVRPDNGNRQCRVCKKATRAAFEERTGR